MKFSDLKYTKYGETEMGELSEGMREFFESEDTPLRVSGARHYFPLVDFTHRRSTTSDEDGGDDAGGGTTHTQIPDLDDDAFAGWVLKERLMGIEPTATDRKAIPSYSPKCKRFIGRVADANTDKHREVPIFLKFTQILDPHAVIQGTYPPPSLLQLSDPRMGKLQHKLSFPFNTAYVDSLASYVASLLVGEGVCPHFPQVYGIYHGSAERHCIEFTEEYHDYKSQSTFQKGIKQKRFSILTKRHCDSESDGEDDGANEADGEGEESEEVDEEDSASEEDEDGDASDLEKEEGTTGSGDTNSTPAANASPNMEISLDQLDVIDDLQSKYHSDDDADDGCIRYLQLHDTPVQIVAMEAFEMTMDHMIKADYSKLCSVARSASRPPGRDVGACARHWRWVVARRTFEKKWIAILMQTCMALVAVQHRCCMVHNDLHTQNIMLAKTDHPYLYYRAYSGCFKVPTYGYVAKIIDMGRATFQIEGTTFMGDVFKRHAEAGEQYTYPHGHYPAHRKSKRPVPPNKAFDLSRLACSMLDDLYARGDPCRTRLVEQSGESIFKGQRRTNSDLFNILCEWITDKHGKPVARFQGFDLYKMLARRMACTAPLYQLRRDHFKQFAVARRVFEAASQRDANAGAVFHLTKGAKAETGNRQLFELFKKKGVKHRLASKSRWSFNDMTSSDEDGSCNSYSNGESMHNSDTGSSCSHGSGMDVLDESQMGDLLDTISSLCA